jgi:hypothetical protein
MCQVTLGVKNELHTFVVSAQDHPCIIEIQRIVFMIEKSIKN